MTPAGRRFIRRAVATASSRLAGSRLKLSSTTSAKTGVAPNHATTSAVAAKVKLGQTTASPGRMPFAISTMASASVPFAQEMTWLRAAEGRKLGFERRDLRPEDVGAMVDDAQDRLVHCGADARALGAKVDEGQGRGHQAISSRRSGAVSR